MDAVSETNAPDAFTDLSLAATALFGGVSNSVPLKSLNRTTIIKQASMKQLPLVIGFFRDVMNGLDKDCLAALVELMADRQTEALQAGKDPSKVSVEEVATVTLVNKAFNNVNLITVLLSSTLESLPKVIPAFTDLTEDEFGSLAPEEGMLIAGGIFMVNYSFFTQSLPPLLTAFMRSWASKNVAIPTIPAKVIQRRK